jgi:soluble lytic murein transglycosylase
MMKPARLPITSRLLALAVISAFVTICPTAPVPAQQAGQGNDALRVPPPTFPAVVQLMSDPARALAALDSELARRAEARPVEGFVLRAHLLSDLGRFNESVAAWDDVARRDPNLGPFAARSAIADLLAARDVDQAALRVRSLVAPRPAAQDDLLLLNLADAYRAAGRPAAASDVYREILGRQRQSAIADRARLGLAASEETVGHLEAALDVLHEATTAWSLAGAFSSARSEERRIAERLHTEPRSLTGEQYFAVAARLSVASYFDDAVTLLEEGRRLQRVDSDDRLEAAIVDYLYRGRQNDAAMARAGQFLARFPGSRLAPSIRLTQLRLDIRLGNSVQARKRLSALQSDRTVPAADRQSAERLVAADLVSAGKPREGLAIFRQMLRAGLPRTDRFDVSWRAGIAAMRAGDTRGAITLLRQARRYAPGRSTPRSTVYWLAAALAKTGSATEAQRLWRQLLAENASDYYGLRCAERLGSRDPAASEQAPSSQPLQLSEAAVSAGDFGAALVLARAGLLDDASSMLASLAGRLRTDQALALLAARTASAAGDYATAWSLVATRFAQVLAQPLGPEAEDIWHMAFPRAFWNEVSAAATKADVDPLLLLSLMRRESRFVVAARSRSGAQGLFQVMPDTAKDIVAAIEDPAESERLASAPPSAEMAARLVRQIMTRFGGATAPVVAAYNAGEDRVQAWWRAAKDLPEDLFVDSIPYGETRQYVREVLANYAIYKRLYGHR